MTEAQDNIEIDDSFPSYDFVPIGHVRTPFRERNGTPRQSGLVPSSRGWFRLDPKWNPAASLDGFQDYSHVWLIFIFDLNTNEARRGARNLNAKVKPPRLCGEKVGVFSSRAPHRPSPIGLSIAKIEELDLAKGLLYLSGMDLCDNTPILDIKPYHPADYVPEELLKQPAWITAPHTVFTDIVFQDDVVQSLREYEEEKKLIFHKSADDVMQAVRETLATEIRSVRKRTVKSQKSHWIWYDGVNFVYRVFQETGKIVVFQCNWWGNKKPVDPDEYQDWVVENGTGLVVAPAAHSSSSAAHETGQNMDELEEDGK